MGEAVGVDELVDSGDDVVVAGDVVEGDGAVLFNPLRRRVLGDERTNCIWLMG